jgi:hypothetical protein
VHQYAIFAKDLLNLGQRCELKKVCKAAAGVTGACADRG